MMLTGKQVIEKLLALDEGEEAEVDGVDWTSLEDRFAVPANACGSPDAEGDAMLFVHRDDLDDFFGAAALYQVVG